MRYNFIVLYGHFKKIIKDGKDSFGNFLRSRKRFALIELPFRSLLAGHARNMAKLLPNKFKNLLGEQYYYREKRM